MKIRIKVKSIIFLLIVLVILTLLIFTFFRKTNNVLENIGYNKLEIEELKNLSDDELNIIYNYPMNENLIYIVKSENYDKSKLDLYLNYSSKYTDISYQKIMELVNNKNFNKDNIDTYIKYINNVSIDTIIEYVNENPEIDLISLKFAEEKYFIKDYLNRYLSYYNNHEDLSYKEIVTRINSNLDHTFYTDSSKADLSKGMYTLVNKFYYLDSNYIPDDLINVERKYARDSAKVNRVAYENFVKMADAMSELGMTIKITTAYRSYGLQSTLYNNYVKSDGKENADTYSARPGYSEHQFGYSMDVTNANLASFGEFEYTDEYNWLKDNSYKYGFILRFPKDKDYITGYQFESWHYRYVGIDIATYMYENDLTYEEYYEYFLR